MKLFIIYINIHIFIIIKVESFELKEIEWVVNKVVENNNIDGFKPNCNIVLIDFFIR